MLDFHSAITLTFSDKHVDSCKVSNAECQWILFADCSKQFLSCSEDIWIVEACSEYEHLLGLSNWQISACMWWNSIEEAPIWQARGATYWTLPNVHALRSIMWDIGLGSGIAESAVWYGHRGENESCTEGGDGNHFVFSYFYVLMQQHKAPTKASLMFAGTQEKCIACNKTVYPIEKVWIVSCLRLSSPPYLTYNILFQ